MTPEQFLNAVTQGWWVPGIVVTLILGGMARWVMGLSRKINDHAERIAYLEAKANGKGPRGDDTVR